MSYELANRVVLGRYIKKQRRARKITMNEWADLVGRSTRTLQGLERGESQGPDTYTLAAEALGVDPEVLFDILSSGSVGTDQQGAGYVASPGVSAEQGVSNAELLAEIRRMRVDVEQIKRQMSRRGPAGPGVLRRAEPKSGAQRGLR